MMLKGMVQFMKHSIKQFSSIFDIQWETVNFSTTYHNPIGAKLIKSRNSLLDYLNSE